MSSELLDIQPKELKFTFELKKQSSCSVQLINKTNALVAFKVKTTSPKKYCVRPNVGIAKPKSTCDFVVTMQAQRVAPPEMICKDKFLVQSTIVPEGTTDEDITSSMFSKDAGRYIEENKLKVVLVSPPQSPTLSPMNGMHKIEDHEASMQNDQVFNKIQFISPHKNKSIEDPRKSDDIEETALPNKNNGQDISHQNGETIEYITLPNNKHNIDINMQNNETIKDITFPNNELSEDINLQKNETIKYINLQKNESIEDISLQKNNTIDDISIRKNRTVEDIISPNNNNSEDISLRNKVAEDAKESKVGIAKGLVGAESVEVGRLEEVEDLALVKDIDKRKSKLSELELKLSEAELMISKLTEERTLSTKERECLWKELAMLKSRSGKRRVQVGFPLLFVVMVALISIVVGYLLHC